MLDVKMTNHQNCRAWNWRTKMCRAWNSRSCKWRTNLQDMKMQDMNMTDQQGGREIAGEKSTVLTQITLQW